MDSEKTFFALDRVFVDLWLLFDTRAREKRLAVVTYHASFNF